MSRLPPEILGNIFGRNTTITETFGDLEERSHNFLLVCHHWFEVASRAPEVWSFWGDNLRDWKRRHLQYPTAPLDLVLSGGRSNQGTLNDSLRGALQDRVARDTIRQIHLDSDDPELLRSIISPLIDQLEEIRSSSVQSVTILGQGCASVDVFDLFSRCRFPKLKRLELDMHKVSSWNPIMSRTPVLTTLVLFIHRLPSISQLLPILGSNPTLREITIDLYHLLSDDCGKLAPRVSLPNLRELVLLGGSRFICELLSQLDHPRKMDSLDICLVDSTLGDVSGVGQYLREYLRLRGKSRGLGLHLSSEYWIKFDVGDVGGVDFSAPGPVRVDKFLEVTFEMEPPPSADQLHKVTLDLIAHVPQEEVVYFRADHCPVVMEGISSQLPCLRTLHVEGTSLHTIFPKPTSHRNANTFPSLQHVILDQVDVQDEDWSSLTTFLNHRASSEGQLDTLHITNSYPPAKVEEGCRRWVREFRLG